VGALVALALAVWRTWSTLAIWLAAVLGEEALNVRLKALIVPPRPSFDRPLVFETSYSYPSGLAMESLVVYGILAHLALLTPWGSGRRAVLVCGTAVLVALIGFGRAYLGAHFLSDVAGEFAAGAHGRAPSSPLERQYAGVRRDLHPAPARPPVLRENVPPCATPGAARCRPLGLPVQKPGSGRGGPETVEIRCGKG
jgi:hypothetical protein